MKKEPKHQELYQSFLNNEATAAELDQLLDFFAEGEEPQLRYLINVAMNEKQEATSDPGLMKRHLEALKEGILARIDGDTPVLKVRSWYSRMGFRVAASFLILAFSCFFLYKNYLSADSTEKIKPACDCATLVTAKGEEIILNEKDAPESLLKTGVKVTRTRQGQLIYSADPAVEGAAAIMNTLVTPLGGKYQVLLSDGTSVVLNSGSSLEFPVSFHGSERRVKLSGEAYFEVSKDPLKPFIVQSGAGITRVLGTKFNVSNYLEDHALSITLIEGKVQVTGNGETALLKPSEQARLDRSGLKISTIDTEDAIAWKNGFFIFKNEELAVIMRQLSRWYNIEVDYSSIPDRRLYMKISRDVALAEVLKHFAVTSNLRFNMEGRRISFMK